MIHRRFHGRLPGYGTTWLLPCAFLIVLAGCGDDPAKLLAQAKASRAKGDHSAAIIQLKSAVSAAPDNGEARYLLGAAYNELRDGANAEAQLRQASQLGVVEGGKVAVELARSLLLTRKFDALLKEVNAKPAFEPAAIAAIHTLRGRAHLALGKLPEARAEFDQAAKLKPDAPETLLAQAAMTLTERDFDGAAALIDKSLAQDPAYYEALMFKGDLMRAKKRNDEALAAYQAAIRIVPGQVAPRFAAASLLIENGKLDEAQKEVTEMSRVGKNNPLVHYLQGFIYFRQAKYRPAQDSIQLGLKGAPDFAPLLLLSGAVNYSLGTFAQAEIHLSQFLRVHPGNLYARKLLAATLSAMNDNKRALEVIQPALGNETQDTTLLALAGAAELRMGAFAKAIGTWEKAVERDPQDASLRYNLAVSRLTAGDAERAIKDLEKAAELDPKDVRSEAQLAGLLLRQLKFDRALEVLRVLDKKTPGNAIVNNMLGVAYLGKADRVGARKAFEQAIAADPRYLQAVSNLAQLDLQDGKTDHARKRFEAVLQKDKDNLEALLAVAGFSQRAGNRVEAVGLLQRAVKAHPDAIMPRAILIDTYLSAEDVSKALQEAREAYSRNQREPGAVDLLGRTQLAAKQPRDAVKTFEELVTLAPDSPLARLRLADALAAAGSSLAEAEYGKALRLKPDYGDAARGLALLKFRAGKSDEAHRMARELQRLQPKSPSGYELEADIAAEQKKFKEAAAAQRRALNLAPSGPSAVKLYMLETRAGNARGGIAALEQWLRANPEDLGARRYLADAYDQNGMRKEAIQNYETLLRQNPDDTFAMNNLATAYYEVKDARALDLAEKAYRARPGDPLTADTLGWILLGSGGNARALELLGKAAAQAPDVAAIRYHYAVALAKAGQKDKARTELEQALATKKKFAEREQAAALFKTL